MVDVIPWFQYAADEVPKLARYVGGIQAPRLMVKAGTGFPIGRLLAEDRAAIPLAAALPQVLRPRLLDAEQVADTLGLEALLQKALADASHAAGPGPAKGPRLVYVDADELPGALKPSALYTVRGEKVLVTLVLTRDMREVARLPVAGVRTDLPGLVARLVTAIEAKVKGP